MKLLNKHLFILIFLHSSFFKKLLNTVHTLIIAMKF